MFEYHIKELFPDAVRREVSPLRFCYKLNDRPDDAAITFITNRNGWFGHFFFSVRGQKGRMWLSLKLLKLRRCGGYPSVYPCRQTIGFYRACWSNHGDEVFWLAFADYLEEHGQPDRADHVRVCFPAVLAAYHHQDQVSLGKHTMRFGEADAYLDFDVTRRFLTTFTQSCVFPVPRLGRPMKLRPFFDSLWEFEHVAAPGERVINLFPGEVPPGAFSIKDRETLFHDMTEGDADYWASLRSGHDAG